jgi:hypothetical protein
MVHTMTTHHTLIGWMLTWSLLLPSRSCRFRETKGGDFGVVQPNPVMKGLFSEENMCEDLASVYNMVPERSNLCVWTQDSASQDKALIMPYVATLDLKLDVSCLCMRTSH